MINVSIGNPMNVSIDKNEQRVVQARCRLCTVGSTFSQSNSLLVVFPMHINVYESNAYHESGKSIIVKIRFF